MRSWQEGGIVGLRGIGCLFVGIVVVALAHDRLYLHWIKSLRLQRTVALSVMSSGFSTPTSDQSSPNSEWTSVTSLASTIDSSTSNVTLAELPPFFGRNRTAHLGSFNYLWTHGWKASTPNLCKSSEVEAWATIFDMGRSASKAAMTNYVLAIFTLERSLRKFEHACRNRPFIILYDVGAGESLEWALNLFKQNGMKLVPVSYLHTATTHALKSMSFQLCMVTSMASVVKHMVTVQRL
jgi:hypothetical protein